MEQQSREARSKENALLSASSNSKAPNSTNALSKKPTVNAENDSSDRKNNANAADNKKNAAVGKFSVTGTKNQEGDDSAQDHSGDCDDDEEEDDDDEEEEEEDVDLEARKRVEELKERLKAGR